jgi:four helix bundle protein
MIHFKVFNPATGDKIMRDFKEIKAWQKSHEFVLKIYNQTKSFPKEEIYGLTSQLRRSSVSIPTNIAEGCGRNSEADFARFLEIAFSSASEVEYLLILSKDLELLNEVTINDLKDQVTEIKRMLGAFIVKLRAES